MKKIIFILFLSLCLFVGCTSNSINLEEETFEVSFEDVVEFGNYLKEIKKDPSSISNYAREVREQAEAVAYVSSEIAAISEIVEERYSQKNLDNKDFLLEIGHEDSEKTYYENGLISTSYNSNADEVSYVEFSENGEITYIKYSYGAEEYYENGYLVKYVTSHEIREYEQGKLVYLSQGDYYERYSYDSNGFLIEKITPYDRNYKEYDSNENLIREYYGTKNNDYEDYWYEKEYTYSLDNKLVMEEEWSNDYYSKQEYNEFGNIITYESESSYDDSTYSYKNQYEYDSNQILVKNIYAYLGNYGSYIIETYYNVEGSIDYTYRYTEGEDWWAKSYYSFDGLVERYETSSSNTYYVYDSFDRVIEESYQSLFNDYSYGCSYQRNRDGDIIRQECTYSTGYSEDTNYEYNSNGDLITRESTWENTDGSYGSRLQEYTDGIWVSSSSESYNIDGSWVKDNSDRNFETYTQTEIRTYSSGYSYEYIYYYTENWEDFLGSKVTSKVNAELESELYYDENWDLVDEIYYDEVQEEIYYEINALGEGESQTIYSDGEEVTLSVFYVGDDFARVSIDEEFQDISEGGFAVFEDKVLFVLDTVYSNRKNVLGYVEFALISKDYLEDHFILLQDTINLSLNEEEVFFIDYDLGYGSIFIYEIENGEVELLINGINLYLESGESYYVRSSGITINIGEIFDGYAEVFLSYSEESLESSIKIDNYQAVTFQEGESYSLDISGSTFMLSLISFTDEEILLSINNVTKSLDLTGPEEFPGLSVALLDIIPSDGSLIYAGNLDEVELPSYAELRFYKR